ncbi:MAG: DUF4258 domain-containing protein [Phycisphaerae bacterium]
MTPLERIRQAFLDHRYTLTEHTYDEMDLDGLDVLDVEAEVLRGPIDLLLINDPRGDLYFVFGIESDLTTLIGIVVRFAENDQLLVITVA